MIESGSPFEAFVEGALQRKSPERAQEGAVVRTVRHAALQAGVTEPNPDLKPLAAKLAVREIRLVPLAMDARLLVEQGSFVIEVGSHLSDFQQRFAVAHELAHVVLGAYTAEFNRRRNGDSVWKSSAELERACDWAAEELMAPNAWLRAVVDPLRPSLRFVRNLASEKSLPADFLARRLLRLGYWGGQLAWCVQRAEGLSIVRRFPAGDRAQIYDNYYDYAVVQPIERCLREGTFEETFLTRGEGRDAYRVWTQCIPLGLGEALALSVLSKEVDTPD